MKEIRELYGQTWSLYGGSRACLFGGIFSIVIAQLAWVTPSFMMVPLFLGYTLLHAVIQFRILTMKHEQLTQQIRAALMVRAARMWYFFVGFTLANGLLEVYIRYFQQTS